jgi:hypothetical protein
MFLDFVIAYVFVAIFMLVCMWRSQRNMFPISGSKEWAGVIALCLVWPVVWWRDGWDL